MPKRSRHKPTDQIKIADERIEILFNEARKMVPKDKRLANRYVQLARKIAMRYNIKLSPKYRKFVCRKCKKYLYPGITSQTRVKNGVVKTKCLQCRKII
ncbi:MAG: ribonuclease P [Candidatus Aenigmatarchaeota archaeon]